MRTRFANGNVSERGTVKEGEGEGERDRHTSTTVKM